MTLPDLWLWLPLCSFDGINRFFANWIFKGLRTFGCEHSLCTSLRGSVNSSPEPQKAPPGGWVTASTTAYIWNQQVLCKLDFQGSRLVIGPCGPLSSARIIIRIKSGACQPPSELRRAYAFGIMPVSCTRMTFTLRASVISLLLRGRQQHNRSRKPSKPL